MLTNLETFEKRHFFRVHLVVVGGKKRLQLLGAGKLLKEVI